MHANRDPEDPRKSSSFFTSFEPEPSRAPAGESWLDRAFRILFSGTFVVSGFGILAFQIYGYLRYQVWTPFSVIDLVDILVDHPWLRTPTDWIGVHSILESIHASIPLLGIGYIIAVTD